MTCLAKSCRWPYATCLRYAEVGRSSFVVVALGSLVGTRGVGYNEGMAQTAYDLDFNLWAREQALALREGRFGDLDLEHLTEEVEELGGLFRDQLESRIIVLMAHLLKWTYQPEERSRSWYATVDEQRRRITRLLKKVPSLKPSVEDVVLESYEEAVQDAIAETELDRDAFPEACSYDFEALFTVEVERPPKARKRRRP